MSTERTTSSMDGYTLHEQASLRQRNTLRVDVRAQQLFEVRDAACLPKLLSHDEFAAALPLVLGEGSNLLFLDDYPGTVLVMANLGVQVEVDAEHVRLAVAAGERWDDFVRWCLAQGYAGLENLILIPGTVGAAPIQNIGAYGCEVAEFIESIEAWDSQTRSVVQLTQAQCAFGYRDSIFKHQPDRYVITAVRFALPRSAQPRLEYAGLSTELARMGVSKPAPFHIAEAVIRLRQRKLPDPAVIGNAGSFFKNPTLDAAKAEALHQAYPDLPVWPQPDGRCKLSAAWLIEASGFKGQRAGDAGISPRHALVLVNHGHASGRELWRFAQQVMAGIAERFDVQLEPEPRIVGHI